uniref:Uncharacterized protein n=1 Tax=Anguilla anguilla TaxID=7936 RepID=A0A0E9Q440_ANGAN
MSWLWFSFITTLRPWEYAETAA